jgi:PPOX class probable F420-dependent enzyme
MAAEITERLRQFIDDHRVARLATSDATGELFLVPICYVFDGVCFYSAIDEKPKRVVPGELRRLRNIQTNPRVALLIDDYSENWSDLAYLLIHGTAQIAEPSGPLTAKHANAVAALRLKYYQYRAMSIEQRPIIQIVPERVHFWSATAH